MSLSRIKHDIMEKKIREGHVPKDEAFKWLPIFDSALSDLADPFAEAFAEYVNVTQISYSRKSQLLRDINWVLRNLSELKLPKNLEGMLRSGLQIDSDRYYEVRCVTPDGSGFSGVYKIFELIIKQRFSEVDKEGVSRPFDGINNPFLYLRVDASTVRTGKAPHDPDFKWLTVFDPDFSELQPLIRESWLAVTSSSAKITNDLRLNNLNWFLINLDKFGIGKTPKKILSSGVLIGSDWFFKEKGMFPNKGIIYFLYDLFEHIINNYFSEQNSDGKLVPLPGIDNIFLKEFPVIPIDETFSWMPSYDRELSKLYLLVSSVSKEFFDTNNYTKGTTSGVVMRINWFLSNLQLLGLHKDPDKLFRSDLTLDSMEIAKIRNDKQQTSTHNAASDFLQLIIDRHYSSYSVNGYQRPLDGIINPLKRDTVKQIGKDPTFNNLSSLGSPVTNDCYKQWIPVLSEYIQDKLGQKSQSFQDGAISSLNDFFVRFVNKFDLPLDPKFIVLSPAIEGYITDWAKDKGWTSQFFDTYRDRVHDLFLFILRERPEFLGLSRAEADKSNPSISRGRSKSGALRDQKLLVISEHEPRMKVWVDACEAYLAESKNITLESQRSELRFLLLHLERCKIFDPLAYLLSNKLDEVFEQTVEELENNDTSKQKKVMEAFRFIEWLRRDIAERDEEGEQHLYGINPLQRANNKYVNVRSGGNDYKESNKFSMPIYLKDLIMGIAFPKEAKSFFDLSFLHECFSADWFEVDYSLIDKADPDCVWREIKKRDKGTVYEMWSPVPSGMIHLHFNSALRNVQIRALDSGEADTYQYVINEGAGSFQTNNHPLAEGSIKRPVNRGVFHMSNPLKPHLECESLFINTNKTADIGKDEDKKGYVTPMLNPRLVTYWLVKVRNWQMKYNPVDSLLSWDKLPSKCFGELNAEIVKRRNKITFLFRNPKSSRDINDPVGIPIIPGTAAQRWSSLMLAMEVELDRQGKRGEDGEKIILTYKTDNPDSNYAKDNPIYSLHSMRVTMISFLVLDLGMPIEIVSKMIAGHSSIVMTLHYTKLTTAYVREVLSEAERRMVEAKQKNALNSLKQKPFDALSKEFASLDIDNALKTAKSASNLGYLITDIGICPTGARTCEIGGECLNPDRKTDKSYKPVPGFPKRNCVRCRFNLSSPAFLNGLKAKFNESSYLASTLRDDYWKCHAEVCQLEDMEYQHELDDLPFAEASRLRRAREREEELGLKLSESISDMNASHHLIQTCLAILADKNRGDKTALVTIGDLDDIKAELELTDSRFYNLAILCQDAEIYKTVDAGRATFQQSQLLDSMLVGNGLPPIFYTFTEDLQLKFGNELIRLLAKHTPNNSIGQALDFAEGRVKLNEVGLLKEVKEATIQFQNGLGLSRNTYIQIENDRRIA